MFKLDNTEIEEARIAFTHRGESVAEWARKHGFKQQLVYKVLNGKSKALRGECHAIAVKLGLKKPIN
jgi:gp16 family phage-associated protein